jgi:uncharacterized membrane protein YbhN (UPF0104 family)
MAVRVLLGVAGIALIVVLVREVGYAKLEAAIVPALPWLPLALVLELARVAMDAVSSRASLASKGAQVPPVPMFLAHVVAFAVMAVAPAGRPTSEVVKASLLARWLGPAPSAALATANQANTLLSSGTFTAASAVAAWIVTGPSTLTWLLVVHFVTMNASGLAIRAAARYARFGAWLGRRFPSLAPHAESFHETSRETSLFPLRPVVAMMIGRAFQAAHFGVLAYAVGLRPDVAGALALHGVYLVIAALGVLVPGQIGATEGGFALAADALHTSAAQAMAIALLAHGVQIVLTIAGLIVLMLWRPPKPDEPKTA